MKIRLATLIVCLLLLRVPCQGQEASDPLLDMFVQADTMIEQDEHQREKELGDVRMPDLTHLSLSESLSRVRYLPTATQLEAVVKKVPSEGPEGIVVMQQPRPGTQIAGTSVTLYVSKELAKSKQRKAVRALRTDSDAKASGSGIAGWVFLLFFQGLLVAVWVFTAKRIEEQIEDERQGHVSLFSSTVSSRGAAGS